MPRNEFGGSWWARRWVAVLEAFDWGDRLPRGRADARGGAVGKISIRPGEARAGVRSLSGTRSVRIGVRPFTAAEWDAVIAAMQQQAIFAAQLLAGEMPAEVEAIFAAAGLALFPPEADLTTSCTCPNWTAPCRHVAAVCYALAPELDVDPFLIFKLRGKDRPELIAALRAGLAGSAPAPGAGIPPAAVRPPAPSAPPLDAADPAFWRLAAPLDDFAVTIAPPARPTALLDSLGPPPFWQPPGGFASLMRAVYARVTDEALRAVAEPAAGPAAGEADGE